MKFLKKQFRKKRSAKSFSLLLVLWASVVPSQAVLAEGCNAITAVPATISEPGTYCLTGDIVASIRGYLITIDSNNVTLDFQGHELRNTLSIDSGYATQSTQGVWVSNYRENVTVRNGRITNMTGAIGVNHNSLVENMKVHGFSAYGIRVGGSGTLVRNNVLSRLEANAPTLRSAIEIASCDFPVPVKGNRIVGNVISDLIPLSPGEAYAIYNLGCDTIIEGNSIDGGKPSSYGSGYIGIYSSNTGTTLAINNRFTRVNQSLKCWATSMSYKDNITYRATPNYCGTDLGGNI